MFFLHFLHALVQISILSISYIFQMLVFATKQFIQFQYILNLLFFLGNFPQMLLKNFVKKDTQHKCEDIPKYANSNDIDNISED